MKKVWNLTWNVGNILEIGTHGGLVEHICGIFNAVVFKVILELFSALSLQMSCNSKTYGCRAKQIEFLGSWTT